MHTVTAMYLEKYRQLVGYSRERVFLLHTRAAGDGDIARQKCTASLPNDLGPTLPRGVRLAKPLHFCPLATNNE